MEPLGITVIILGAKCCNIKLVYILIKKSENLNSFKQVKRGMFVLLNAECMHPVTESIVLIILQRSTALIGLRLPHC